MRTKGLMQRVMNKDELNNVKTWRVVAKDCPERYYLDDNWIKFPYCSLNPSGTAGWARCIYRLCPKR